MKWWYLIMWQCLEKVAFISFLSFYAGLVIILWLTGMKFRNLTKCYRGFAKVTNLVCYSQTVDGKLLILHLLSINLYFTMFMYFLKTVQSFQIIFFLTEIFGITWIITYSRKLHSLKTSGELFWIILRLILVVFT